MSVNVKLVRILVADDHELVRRGLVTLFEAQPGWKVVAQAENGQQAIELARRVRPDVAVLDISMPELSGLDATRELVRLDPEIRVLVLTMHFTEQLVRKVLEAGARAYVLKTDTSQELVHAVRSVLDSTPFFTSTVSKVVLDGYLSQKHSRANNHHLTRREMEIIRLMADGKGNKEMAASLNISLRTVEKHRANIMHKLHLQSLGDLVHYAVANGIVGT